ncbi:MAG: nickel pincer cofactor biosynthesis protein LarB [Desulfamplus sp.]|nr:nickel pincer cofactor biosynthesis protein LarB [Desulfamplus sp.]
MNEKALKNLLESVANGAVSVKDAQSQLKNMAFEDVDGYASVDHHRTLRKGFPEVIFGQGKTSDQIVGIMSAMSKASNETILVTRIEQNKALEVIKVFSDAQFYDDAKMLILSQKEEAEIKSDGNILIISAGTSDIPVAKEAYLTAKAMGNRVSTIFDVGVAGIHRLFAHRKKIESASVIVVVAGMEGALPSVVAGMVKAPVIAVPTSIGYGAGFGGIAALLGMLNSCSSNVAVVNIDNGFGAGYMASSINQVSRFQTGLV